MRLSYPMSTTPRLLPGVRVGDAWLSIEFSERAGDNGRARYRYSIDLPDGTEYVNDDLQSGCGGGLLLDGLCSLLAFLGACGESYAYAMREGIDVADTENGLLFPAAVAEWCAQESDALACLALDLEENPGAIAE